MHLSPPNRGWEVAPKIRVKITNAYSGTLLITRDEWPTYIKYDITASCGVF